MNPLKCKIHYKVLATLKCYIFYTSPINNMKSLSQLARRQSIPSLHYITDYMHLIFFAGTVWTKDTEERRMR